ncbi:MAG: flagellar M-ring protein FliF [Deltaproteobacteria bacterium]|nr:flagellar M-ring protein FliF [Deltaproteobacteria bacterium]
MAFWDTGLAQARDVWGRLAPAQKLVFVAVSVGLAAGFLWLAFSVATPRPDSLLFSRLSPDDAGQIVKALQAEGVPYRLEDSGRSILVPGDRVYDLRLKLASEGVPQGGVVGFEIFDKSGFGMTDFAQKVNYARALEGELTRTIRRLDGVDGARVHLVLPEKKLFEEQSEPASASIVLQLSAGSRLSAKQIQGVVYLTSSSVEGLKPDRVTVVDTKGNVLYQSSGDETAMLAASQIEYKRAYEKDVERRVREMLETVLGSGAAVVQVAAYFDFDRVEETSETFDPEATAVRSEQRATESTSGPTGPQGVPGVASNVAGATGAATAPAPASGGGASSKETETVNYEVSKKVTRVQKSQGSLKRLTVAVAVDGVYKAVQGKKEKEFSPRTADDLAKIRSLVEKAVGVDANRGDQVEVTSIPFRPAEGIEEAKGMFGPEFYMALARYGVLLLVALVLVFGVGRPLLRWLASAGAAPELTGPMTVAEMEERLAAASGGEGGAARAPQEYQLDETTPEETLKRESLKKRITELVHQEPEVAAQLVRSWLSEG